MRGIYYFCVDCVNPSRAAALHSCAHLRSSSRSSGLFACSAARAHSLARSWYNFISESMTFPRVSRSELPLLVNSAGQRTSRAQQWFASGWHETKSMSLGRRESSSGSLAAEALSPHGHCAASRLPAALPPREGTRIMTQPWIHNHALE
jgi:hypothetical protein